MLLYRNRNRNELDNILKNVGQKIDFNSGKDELYVKSKELGYNSVSDFLEYYGIIDEYNITLLIKYLIQLKRYDLIGKICNNIVLNTFIKNELLKSCWELIYNMEV